MIWIIHENILHQVILFSKQISINTWWGNRFFLSYVYLSSMARGFSQIINIYVDRFSAKHILICRSIIIISYQIKNMRKRKICKFCSIMMNSLRYILQKGSIFTVNLSIKSKNKVVNSFCFCTYLVIKTVFYYLYFYFIENFWTKISCYKIHSVTIYYSCIWE